MSRKYDLAESFLNGTYQLREILI